MRTIHCPACGKEIEVYANPVPTVDIIIASPGRGIVLVERRCEPLGWALPGGFVDYGESVEKAAVREAAEETGLTVVLRELLGVYSDPNRDRRLHTISTVFVASTDRPQDIRGGDDAVRAAFFPLNALPGRPVFDHMRIIDDFTKRFAVHYGV